MVMPMVKPVVATSMSSMGLTKGDAATTSAGLPRGRIVPAAMVMRNMPASP